ncbi:Transmembrane osmosensor [Mucor circinelloides]
MQLNTTHITKNPIVLVSVVMSVVGWLITFIGACIIGRAGLLWWIVIYELLLLGGIFFSIFRQVFHHYQIVFLVFLGISISMLTGTIDGLIHYTSGGNQAAGAGAVMLIVMQFFWVILFGSTEDSLVYQFIYSGFVSPVSQNVVNIGMHGSGSPKESKVALSSPEATGYHTHQQQPSIASVHQHHQHQSPVMNTPIIASNSPGMAPQQAQKLTATALHPYTANPDDPNELSFQKEEVLEILNKSGNWWQAKKQDGTIGIVPSNYVSCMGA